MIKTTNQTQCSDVDCVCIGSIMKTNLKQLNESDSIYKALEMFKTYQIRHLPVVRNNKIVGILSTSDFNKEWLSDPNIELTDYTVGTFMTWPVDCVDYNRPLTEVAALISHKHYHAMPVVKDDKLVGIVSTSDIILELLNFTKQL